MRAKKLDNFLLLAMSFVALFCFYHLYLNSNKSNNAQDSLAYIESELNVVKLKKDFYQSWTDASSGDLLSVNDEIYTHSVSGATIKFKNGNKVELSENSLIKIKNINSKDTLELDKGNLVANLSQSNPELNLTINGKNYSLHSKDAKIQIEKENNENKFIVLSGTVNLKSKDKDFALNRNDIITSKSDSTFEKTQFNSEIVQPNAGNPYYFNHPFTIPINVKNQNQDETAKVLVSRNRKFKDIIFEKPAIDNIDFPATDEGLYYLKVTSSKYADSPIVQIRLIKELKPNLNVKRDLIYRNSNITFGEINWNNQAHENFQVYLQYPNHETKIFDTSDSIFTFPLNELGNYKTRIKLNHVNHPEAIFSDEKSIEYKKIDKIEIELLNPKEVTKVSYTQKDVTQRILIKNTLEDSISKIVILKNNEKYIEENFSNATYNLILNTPGTYTYTIVNKYEDITSNKLEGTIYFKKPIKIKAQGAAIIELDRPDQLVNLTWNKIQNQNNYQVEIADNENFYGNLITGKSNTNSFNTNLVKTGKYFWRVKMVNERNETDFSEPISVEIKPSPPLKAPINIPDIKIKIEETNKSSLFKKIFSYFINLANADENVSIAKWNLIENKKVKLYIIEIYRDNQLKELVTRIESETPHAEWKNPESGNFYWRIAYKDYWDRTTDFSKLSKIELIKENIKKEEVKIIKPLAKVETLPKKIEISKVDIKPIKEVKAVVLKPEELKEVHHYSIIYSPHGMASEVTDNSNKIKITGIVLDSFKFNYVNEKMAIESDFSRGKVFKNITFNNLSLHLSKKIAYNGMLLNPKISTDYLANYSIANQTVTSKNKISIVAGSGIIFSFYKFENELTIQYGSYLNIAVNSKYQLTEKYFAGVFGSLINASKFDQTVYGINLGFNL